MKPNEHQGPRILVVGGGVAGLILVTRLGHALGRRGLARITLIERGHRPRCPPQLPGTVGGGRRGGRGGRELNYDVLG